MFWELMVYENIRTTSKHALIEITPENVGSIYIVPLRNLQFSYW